MSDFQQRNQRLEDQAGLQADPQVETQPSAESLQQQGDAAVRRIALPPAKDRRPGEGFGDALSRTGRESNNVDDHRRKRIPFPSNLKPFEPKETGWFELASDHFAEWCDPLYEFANQFPPRDREEAMLQDVARRLAHDAYLKLPKFTRFQLHMRHPLISIFAMNGSYIRGDKASD